MLVALAGCGSDDSGNGSASASNGSTQTSRVEVIRGLAGDNGGFDPATIYKSEAPGVVTVVSQFGSAAGLLGGGDGDAGLGTGFVISDKGEIATNAHVVTTGQGGAIRRASQVYVKFADGNSVPARIVGHDPFADVALLRVSPGGLTLRPLPLGSSRHLIVGAPVAAIGSPFGEPQSLSVGVISALDRTIDSLTSFAISGAIQTDAAINHGNSGGPLVDSGGRVLGINSQIRSTGGGGEGVGFAIPIDQVRKSLDQLRRNGRVAYAYIGVSSVQVFPQLAKRLKLPVDHGALLQSVVSGGPGDKAGLRSGDGSLRFQAQLYRPGGDLVTAVDGKPIQTQADLGELIGVHDPGDKIKLTVYRGSKRRTVEVTLGTRPLRSPRG
jgi:S1-C subfamily serine protease